RSWSPAVWRAFSAQVLPMRTLSKLLTSRAALSGFTPGYVSLDIHWIDTTHATATFTSLSSGTTLYRMGDGSTADLNVAGSFSAAFGSESGTRNRIYTNF